MVANEDVQYETKDMQTVRGMESRARAKAEAEGWEFVRQSSGPLLRSTLSFRRPKKKVSRSQWIAGGAAAAALIVVITVGVSLERASSPSVEPSPHASGTAAASGTPTQAANVPAVIETPVEETPVSDAEVLSVFNDYFAERAAAGVLVGKAVTGVTYVDGVVRVTFDPEAAGVTKEYFDSVNSFENMAKFAATPICFSDVIGDRVRPAVDSIETVRADGVPMGAYSRADILALNGLEK